MTTKINEDTKVTEKTVDTNNNSSIENVQENIEVKEELQAKEEAQAKEEPQVKDKKKKPFGKYLCVLFKYNEFTMFVMGMVTVIVCTCMFLVVDRYAIAQERIAQLEAENAEIYNFLVVETLTQNVRDRKTRQKLQSYKEMLIKKYK